MDADTHIKTSSNQNSTLRLLSSLFLQSQRRRENQTPLSLLTIKKMTPFLHFFLLLIPPLITTSTSNCIQTCGSTPPVPYPFGFSPSCKIPLNCTASSRISIGGFLVRNITSDRILLDVPPSCLRPLNSTSSLLGRNFAPTKRNGLFLRGCNSTSSIASCSISTDLISNRLSLLRCDGPKKNDSVSCYARIVSATDNGEGSPDFLTRDEIVATGCASLFTAVNYEVESNLSALVFSTLELGWWVDGVCGCSANANCTRLASPVTGQPGFRCRCREGFEGDGFVDGRGCEEVPHCGSSIILSRNCGGSAKIGVLAGGIIAGASIMTCVAFFIYFIRRRCTSSRTKKRTKCLLSEASFNVPFYPYKTIERATDSFDDTHRLGTGAYGTVYVGNLSNGELIAVKKIKHPDPETIEQVKNEVKMISSVNHPNLVRLLGCCIDKGEQILVYEFMPNGTLAEHLQRQRGPGLPWTIRLAIATETAKALAYLHSSVHPPIYHRDIKSSNILLDHQFNAKIADFGLSRAIITDSSHISTVPQGTPGYVDPQYHQNYHLSDKSDVYSFGVVLLEIITAMKVVDFNRVQTEVNLALMAVDRIAKGRVEEIIDPFLKVQTESWTFGSVHKVAELAFRCLAFHRDMRPSMMEVADELEQIRQSCWAPKDGEVELCSSSLIKSASDGQKIEGKSKRLVFVSARVEKVNSPVSVQDNWVSEQSTPSSSSLLGYPNGH